MSRNRYSRLAVALPRDPDGTPLCRWCGAPVKPPRRTWCSEACIDEYLIRSFQGFVRARLFKRDHGVCQNCGLDCDALKTELLRLRQAGGSDGYPIYSGRWIDFLSQMGLDILRNHSPWEAHHILAVREGGGECGLDNYTTLCWRCHRRETGQQRRRWARVK